MTTSPIARLYALTAAVLGLFLAWVGIAAHPWQQTQPDASSQLVAQYEARLREDAGLVAQVAALRRKQQAAPLVRIVTLPPLTTTRTS